MFHKLRYIRMYQFKLGQDDEILQGGSEFLVLGIHLTMVGLDFLKSPSSCLFSTRRTKDFSYLIAANFSDPTSTNRTSPGYPLGTELYATKRDLRLNSIWGRLRRSKGRGTSCMYFCLRNIKFGHKCLSKVNLRHWISPFR